jgi:hypothetical protein
MLYGEHNALWELAAKGRLPTMYGAREFVEDGADVLRGGRSRKARQVRFHLVEDE